MAVLGGAAAAGWSRGAKLQTTTSDAAPAPSSNAPLVGFLNAASPGTYRFNADAFRQGLAEAGFVEGRNVRIEERWANGDYQALPKLAAELVAKLRLIEERGTAVLMLDHRLSKRAGEGDEGEEE